MAFTIDELNIINQAFGKLGASRIQSISDIASIEYIQADLHYSQSRNALQRSFEWPFASGRTELKKIKTIALNLPPMPAAWSVGAIVTGISSYVTATILTVYSNTNYSIAYLSGDFTDGEKITDGTVEQVFWENQELMFETEYVLWVGSGNEAVCGNGYPVVANLSPDFEWNYCYCLPADYSRLKSKGVDEDRGYDRTHRRYEIEGNVLLTDYDTVHIKYIKKITDPTKFDLLFTEILILQLALKLFHPVAGTAANVLKQGILQELAPLLSQARTICKMETETSGRSSWNLARYGSGKPLSIRK